MRIRVEMIPGIGQQVELPPEATWGMEAAEAALETSVHRVSASFALEPVVRGKVDVAVKASAEADGVCDRCGHTLIRTISCDVVLRYVPAGTGPKGEPGDDGIELTEDELDVGWYEDGSLVLADVLTEALTLASPSRTLCEDKAGCDARFAALLDAANKDEVGHPAFAALKNLKN